MLTKAEKQRWLNRLRDPNSRQYRGGGMKYEHVQNATGNESMCCLVHGEFAVTGKSKRRDETGATYWSWCEKHAIPTDILIDMNDKERKTLPEIADWIEANIPTSD